MTKAINRRHALGALGAFAITTLAGAGCASRLDTPPVRRVRSSASDGVELAVYETGNPRGRPVIFIHGFAQSHESWSAQMQALTLQSELRLISFDLRGHGDSGKPLVREAYHDPQRWAHDLRSVMQATGADKPCIVAWSYGGRVVNDYLQAFGDGDIGSINYVAATSTAQRFGLGSDYALIGGMLSDDPAVETRATLAFLRACFEKQPTEAQLKEMERFNALTPVAVRKLLAGRPADYDDALRRLKVPVLITHGDRDRISALAMSEYTLGLVPVSKLSLYQGAGHGTFFEEPMRFNAELLALARAGA
jgi:pimeloyl-ACP methyl ester carboxylesterase